METDKKTGVTIRLMKPEDYNAVLEIDRKALKVSRPEYYTFKFERLVQSKDYVPISLVAEEDGKVVGFIMGELYRGEYGIDEEKASLHTIGVDPGYRRRGVGNQLMTEFMDHLKSLGVQKLNTLVSWDDPDLIRFFSANQFRPSKIINLDRSL